MVKWLVLKLFNRCPETPLDAERTCSWSRRQGCRAVELRSQRSCWTDGVECRAQTQPLALLVSTFVTFLFRVLQVIRTAGVLTNRSAAHLKVGRASEAEADATAALELESSHIKVRG